MLFFFKFSTLGTKSGQIPPFWVIYIPFKYVLVARTDSQIPDGGNGLRGGGGGTPHNSCMGMYHPMGLCFWDSDLECGIIFKPFLEWGAQLSSPILIEWGTKKIVSFLEQGVTSVANPL